jgi:hypothetical protein
LPDYVSLFGEDNFNSVINLNTGNTTVQSGSMIIVGQNATINNLVINISDTLASNIANGLYISNKSNVVVDNCIFTTSPQCNTIQKTSFIWMDNAINPSYSSNPNRITNCEFIYNNSLLLSDNTAIHIQNTTPLLQNNTISINSSNSSSSGHNTGIELVDCSGIPSFSDKPILDNIRIYNNYENTIPGGSNYGIHIKNSNILIKNSIIECNNDPALTTNNGIILESTTPLITTTSTNVLSFVHYTTPGQLDQITSNNTGIVNFTTLGFMRGQYITVSGTHNGLNDGLYKIANVINNSTLELIPEYRVINQSASALDTITIQALYDVEIESSDITGSTNAVINIDNNIAYRVNLCNNIILGDVVITPSRIIYTNYKTITVGKANCDYTLLSTALADINDSSATNQYNIQIESGIYQEPSFILCKPYINIEGNGSQNTILQFYQAEDTPTPTNNSSCLLLASHSKISHLKVINSSTLNTTNALSTVLYMADIAGLEDVILEDVVINSVCGSVYNYGIYLSNVNDITLTDINITVQSNNNASTTPELNVGVLMDSGSTRVVFNNVNIIVDAGITNENVGISFIDTNATLNNITGVVNSGINQNIGIKTHNTTINEKLIEIFNGIINAADNIEYSIFCDNYYTIVCNGVDLIGDTYTSPVSSRIICNSCYTFTSSAYNTSYQSLNSRGENEQSQGTITIGDSAGKLGSTGINNTFVGVNCGSNITTGSYNSGFGKSAGSQITTADNNTLIGNNAGAVLNNGNNTIIGSNAGESLQTGTENTIIGTDCAANLTDGNVNVIIGAQAGSNIGGGSYINTIVGTYSYINTSDSVFGNTALGFGAGALGNTGNLNVFIGAESGLFGNGDNNVLVGTESGLYNQASNITAIGTSAGMYNNYAIQNTYLGFQSGLYQTGNCNTILGNNAGLGYSLSSAGSYNTLIGNEAGYSVQSGSRNILVGSTSAVGGADAAGWHLSSGSDNILIGVKSGSNATTATNNVVIGSNVGSNIITSSNNVLIGKDTATSLNTNGYSVIIGAGAGDINTVGNALIVGYNAGVKNNSMGAFAIGYSAGSNVSGDFNMFMGYNAGGLPKLNTTGAYNIAIGPYTGYNLTSGTRNIILGSGDSVESAGRLISTGSDNTLMGFKAGRALQLGSGNTLIGSNAGANLTNGVDNLILGYKSGFNLNTGSYNVVLGPEAGYNLNTGGYNIYSGYQSGYNNQSGDYNINVGYKTGFTSTTNANNIHIGYEAGYLSVANDNIFVGTNAGVKNTTGTNNIFVGQNTGTGNNPNNQQIGDNNIFVGTSAGNANENGYRNIFLGYQAGKSSIGGSKNVFIGENTGSTSSTSHNIFIGSARDDNKGVGYLATASGEYNVFVGHDVGIANTTGDHNIFMGDSAGKNNTTGTQNIYIGTNAGRDANAATADNNIAMGTDAGILNQSGKENILIGKQVAGLSTSTDYNQNIIIGSEAGQNIQQNNQIFIGTNAGKNNTIGNRNIFIGLNAGTANVDSQDNVVIGSDAGASLVGMAGIGDNVIIGSQAGHDLQTGINNIFIGSNSGANAITGMNNVVVGANSMSVGDASNVIIMGNEAGKLNNSDYNICIGYQAGKNNDIGGSNIIMGANSLPNGKIADNNVVVGTDAGKNIDSPLEFLNNLVLGKLAGLNSNVASGSLIMGTRAGGVGSGGENNILMGYEVANNLGTLYYKAETVSAMNIGDNYVSIDLPFGSATYYFKFGDYVRIYNPATISTTQDFTGGYITAIIIIDANTTQVVLDTPTTILLPSGSIMYKVNANSEYAGLDTSKAAANICMGFNTGYSLRDGSKNAAIGDSAMFNNKVGKNNVAFGSKAGYTLNTNNNLCLGTNAGYSLDEYVNSNTSLDMTFYSGNNTVVFNTGAPGVYPYGSVFEIDGSTSNDGRYNVNNSSTDSIVVQGFPNIQENGLPVSLKPDDYKLNVQDFYLINYNTTITTGDFDNATNILRIEYPTSGDALAAYNTIANAGFFKITNSQFNDGMHTINSMSQIGSNVYITSNIGMFGEVISTNIDFAIRNISTQTSVSHTNPVIEAGFMEMYPQNYFYLQFGSERGTYTLDKEMIIYDNSDPFANPGIYANSTYVNENINNGQITNNILYKYGSYTTISPASFYDNLVYYPFPIIFSKADNLITFNTYYYFATNRVIRITGTQYNDGYYLLTSINSLPPTTIQFVISTNTPIQSDETTSGNVLIEALPNNCGLFANIFGSSPNWNGRIVNLHYKSKNTAAGGNGEDFEHKGTYIVENLYNASLGINDKILNTNIQSYNFTNRLLSLSDNGVVVSSDAFKNYLSGVDIAYQNSNITLSVNIYTSNSTIIANNEFGFVDFITPVMVKIEGSLSGNDGYYLVKENHHPFNKMVIDGSFSGSNETTTLTIKQNSISSLLATSNLATFSMGNNYTIYGSKYNDGITITPASSSAINNASVYIDESVQLNNDVNGEYEMYVAKDYNYTAAPPNIGRFIHFNYNETIDFGLIDITIYTTSGTDLYNSINRLAKNHYLKITNTSGGINDGIFVVDAIYFYGTYFYITFSSHYIRNGISYSGTAFTVGTYTATLGCNEYVRLDTPGLTNNIDFKKLFSCIGSNSRFLSFQHGDTSNLFITSNHITFENDSYPLYSGGYGSNIAISLAETCPDEFVDLPHFIGYGEPNPSTIRTSDINRKKRRPIFYSQKKLDYSVNTDNTTNTITILPPSLYVNSCVYYYDKVQNPYIFDCFQIGEIIAYTLSGVVPSVSYVKILSISPDKSTIYLDPTYSTIPTFSGFALSNLTVYKPYVLTTDRLNFSELIDTYTVPSSDNINYRFQRINTYLSNNPVLFINQNAMSVNFTNTNINNLIFNNTTLLAAMSLGLGENLHLARQHSIIVPSQYLTTNYTDLFFHNATTTGSSDITFDHNTNTIQSTITDLSIFLPGEYIQITGTSNNNYLYRIDQTSTPSTNLLTLSSISGDRTVVNETNTSATILANCINTRNISTTPLIVFGGGQQLIVSKTEFNNTTYTSNITSNSEYSIFIDSSSVSTEYPRYCTIEKSVFNNEFTRYYGSGDISFFNSNNTIYTPNTAIGFDKFAPLQNITISNTTFNNTTTNITDSIPTENEIITNGILTDENNTNAIISKNITFSLIGEPVQAAVSSSFTELYHYEDAEGNNAMIGSYAGQYVGALNNAIYNVAIGSRCGQVNHGSGNIFIGNESRLATSAADGATTYSNKFAIYKNNFIGVPANPIIGGDFTTGRVGINTITPESYNYYSEITVTDTKLVVNGGAIANSFSPFTGCHLVYLDLASNVGNVGNVASDILPGMIMSSTGKVDKPMIINTFVSVAPSSKLNDKKVFGVYAYSEQSRKSDTPEYIIDSSGKYIKNPAYNTEMLVLNYVAALGEGQVLVSNITGEIGNGDYITSSVISGYGCLQADDILHSYTVAKCTEDIDWDNLPENILCQNDGKMYKSILVACTYHCG